MRAQSRWYQSCAIYFWWVVERNARRFADHPLRTLFTTGPIVYKIFSSNVVEKEYWRNTRNRKSIAPKLDYGPSFLIFHSRWEFVNEIQIHQSRGFKMYKYKRFDNWHSKYEHTSKHLYNWLDIAYCNYSNSRLCEYICSNSDFNFEFENDTNSMSERNCDCK